MPKQLGVTATRPFTHAMAQDLERQREQAEAIGQGLLEEPFRPWFPPVIDRPGGAVTALRVLARWEEERRGIVLPQELLAVVEAHKLAERLGMQSMQQAFRIMVDCSHQGLPVPVTHFNMSRWQRLAPAMVDKVRRLMDDTDISSVGLATITRLGATKVESAPDLTDKLFLERRAEKTDLYSGLLSVGELLNIGVVEKGVETVEQTAFLGEPGFTEMRGNLIAEPMTQSDMRAWLEENARIRAARASAKWVSLAGARCDPDAPPALRDAPDGARYASMRQPGRDRPWPIL